MTPKIIYEDSFIVVVDKPAGMVVNRAETVKGVETVQDWVEKKLVVSRSSLVDNNDEDFYKRSGIVHRLDKETSGLLIIAKEVESFKNLQQQFKEGRVEKTYIALCHGKVTPQEGEINVPIGRLPWNRKRFGVIPMGRESRTLYKVLSYKNINIPASADKGGQEILSLLELYPKTGRTHQIRVHLLYIGHPIFGDALYAGRKNIKFDRKLLPRHFLHASRIKFAHPKTQQMLEFEAPLSAELLDFLSSLK